jgi:hypothetical protein
MRRWTQQKGIGGCASGINSRETKSEGNGRYESESEGSAKAIGGAIETESNTGENKKASKELYDCLSLDNAREADAEIIKEEIKKLLDKAADINWQNNDSYTALM